MTVISGLGQVGPIRLPPRARAGGPSFHVAEDVRMAAAGTPSVFAMAGASSLLSLQEAELETVQDREARRHGTAMLALLARLQRALLGGPGTGGDGVGALESLASMVRAAPVPDDPRLAAVQRAVLVRAAVELARARLHAAASV